MTTEMSEQDRAELLEAQRLADVLDAVEAGRTSGVDAREDPELASLLATTQLLRASWSAAAPLPGYAARSRTHVLDSMRPAAMRPAALRPAAPQRGALLVLLRPSRWRWTLLAPVASAAAAAVVTFAVSLATLGGGSGDARGLAPTAAPAFAAASDAPRPSFVEGADAPAVQQSVERELARLTVTLEQIHGKVANGERIDELLLSDISRSASFVSRQIVNSPDAVKSETVVGYAQAVVQATPLLRSAQIVASSEPALLSARLATTDGAVVAARYFARNTR